MSHADLSEVALDFLTYLAEDPQGRASAAALPEPPAWLRAVTYPMQPWPTFLGGRKVAQIERATVGVMRLVEAAPQRVFGTDAAALARYCQLDEQLAPFLFDPPNGVAGTVARCDFIDTPSGLKCLEVNTGKIGGWQQRFWEQHFRTAPLISRFLAERGIAPVARDPWRELLRYVVEEVRRTPICHRGEINVVLALDEPDYGRMAPVSGLLAQVYQAVLDEFGEGLGGRAAFASYPEGLRVDRELRVHLGGVPIHAVVECTHQLTPAALYRTFKKGRILLFSGPLHQVVADKRNLALLSEHGQSDLWSPEERALIADHVPWTRTVEDRTVVWQGEEAPVVDLLRRHRESFVIKPARGMQGADVLVGERVAPEVWERAIATAMVRGLYIAQERQISRPYLCQHGDVGGIPHDVIWGLFCFGNRYGGGFLRQMPQGQGDGVINSERGAVEGFLFEV